MGEVQDDRGTPERGVHELPWLLPLCAPADDPIGGVQARPAQDLQREANALEVHPRPGSRHMESHRLGQDELEPEGPGRECPCRQELETSGVDVLAHVGWPHLWRRAGSPRRLPGGPQSLESERPGSPGRVHLDDQAGPSVPLALSFPVPVSIALSEPHALREPVGRIIRMTHRSPKRRAPAFLALALALSVLSPATSSAATSFTFYGSGYGHGLGLPQWGAYGLALKGWSHQKILGHFYKSTKIATAPTSPGTLRIGLVQSVKTVHVSSVQGSVELHVGWTGGTLIGRAIKQGETWRVLVDGSGRYRVLDGAGKMVGGHLWGSTKVNIYAVYAGKGKVRMSEAGHTYNRGYVEFNLYPSKACSKVAYCERLIIVLKPQSYLFGLAEVPSSWPMEALQTQAVAARTYAFEKVARVGQHRSGCNCGLYDDTRDQVYAGWDKEGGAQGSRWVSAVTDTNRVVVLYNGAPIQAYYHSASGGFTENNEFVWGGTPLPYLRGVCDPGDYTQANPNTVWTVGPLSDTAVTTKLRPYTGNIGTVTKFATRARGVSGRIVTVRVVGTSGQADISGTSLRRALALKDDRVWINAD